jgi:hypothetical protein
MAARASDRIVEVVEELLVELPARLRGSRTRLSEQALASEPTPGLVDGIAPTPAPASASASREKRRQRRRSRPHGRAR